MQLPPEICGRICGAIRQWDNRFVVEKTLASLSAVSKTWRPEALRSLWYKVVIDEDYKGNAEPRGTAAMVSLIVNKGYGHYIRDLKIGLNFETWPEEKRYLDERFSLRDKIVHILLTATNVHTLWISSYRAGGILILPHLYRCHFPVLRDLTMHISLADDGLGIDFIPPPDGLDLFFVNHPGLQELSFYIFNCNSEAALTPIRVPWTKTRELPQCLPNLISFTGGPEEIKLLRPSVSLKEVTLWVNPLGIIEYDQEDLFRDLKDVDGPFLYVTHLEMMCETGPFLDCDLLEEINRCFPNLEVLEGVDLHGDIVDDLLSSKGGPRGKLQKLKELLYEAMVHMDVHDNSRLEKAIVHLPHMFPSLRYVTRCVHPVGHGHADAECTHLYFQFDENGTISSREKRRKSM
ncbi:hypothetical protein SISSUDRAFT_1129248 [Sistotremastrum suecicum HHB10207 ss-3]|uniref:Uncharacterized protein n=1 Tax=Sistotremastrum suecicum HHB10207 ss-3 TaxID=1314776 RepID=A0A166CVU2_9AGAM|nr:hypothetical protein SISSUDRAFT_1129248 [Sistotremastrum suecicum HHB10207 ss-3]